MTKTATGEYLQDWAQAHASDGSWDQVMFVRDVISALFGIYGRAEDEARVIGTHTSKSVLLPVYRITWRGTEVTLRGNFHDWSVSVSAHAHLRQDWHEGVIDPDPQIGFEGFPRELVYKPYGNGALARRGKFSFSVRDDYELYTACYLLVHDLKNRNRGQ